jgi:hypothetical protein
LPLPTVLISMEWLNWSKNTRKKSVVSKLDIVGNRMNHASLNIFEIVIIYELSKKMNFVIKNNNCH